MCHVAVVVLLTCTKRRSGGEREIRIWALNVTSQTRQEVGFVLGHGGRRRGS